MISARHLKDNLHQLLKLAEKDGMEFKLVYKGQVFIVNLTKTGETYKVPMKRYKRKGQVDLYVRDCKACNAVMVDGMCISRSCSTNTGQSQNEDQGVVLRRNAALRPRARKREAQRPVVIV